MIPLRPMAEAPQEREIIVATTNRANCRGYLIAHWACDKSGEHQPPFEGWYYWTGHGFSEVLKGDLMGWCDLPPLTHWEKSRRRVDIARSIDPEAFSEETEKECYYPAAQKRLSERKQSALEAADRVMILFHGETQ